MADRGGVTLHHAVRDGAVACDGRWLATIAGSRSTAGEGRAALDVAPGKAVPASRRSMDGMEAAAPMKAAGMEAAAAEAPTMEAATVVAASMEATAAVEAAAAMKSAAAAVKTAATAMKAAATTAMKAAAATAMAAPAATTVGGLGEVRGCKSYRGAREDRGER
ncbi:hypothetical protein [Bradyrhizobium sp. NP1]|uniref:hypothetical protein n=1 Tax=Bradyrhizobium sp. NP1 TaxID=3049772 RepID=UPI0025A4D576|nr:hypothetical protein [Bradyrhizobium sp. NP1]WJR77468.1 hypothetical protein QOU61_32910 [Bradyrhizobium sp. NP1]